jgi:hypothetical protein
MKTMRKWKYSSSILDLATRWMWAVIFKPRPLYPQERAPDTYWIGDWVGPWRCEGERYLFSQPGIKPRPSSPSLYRLSCCSASAVEADILLPHTRGTYCMRKYWQVKKIYFAIFRNLHVFSPMNTKCFRSVIYTVLKGLEALRGYSTHLNEQKGRCKHVPKPMPAEMWPMFVWSLQQIHYVVPRHFAAQR